jgi:hypothetical protein
MTRRSPILRLILSLLLVSGTSMPTAADPEKQTDLRRQRGGVPVSTGLVSLPAGHTYRVMVTKVGKDDVPIEVSTRIIDERGREVARKVDTLRGGRAAIIDLERFDIERAEPVLLRTQLRLRPLQPPGPGEACPLTLTIQTVEGDLDDGPFETCGVNPCCPNCGPPGFPGVQFVCGGSDPVLLGP